MRRATAVARVCFLLSALTATMLWTGGCDKKPPDTTAAAKEVAGKPADKAEKKPVVSDSPLAPFQIELIDLAFDAATAIPVDPHIKDRSRAQEAVVTTCLKLDKPERALYYIGKIENWRQGSCYADLAFYYAQHGRTEDVQKYLDLAEQVAQESNSIDWRTDTLNVKIAQTQVLLGNIERARVYEANVVESQTGKVAAVRAMTGDVNSFDEQVKTLEELVARGNFDITVNGLDAYAQLFKRFYADPNRRSFIEERIKMSWNKAPAYIRVDFFGKLAGFALAQNDPKKALELLNEAQSLVDGHTWPLEYHIQTAAKLAGLRFHAGDKEKAKSDANVLLALYDANSAVIVNIYRAGALRPLAEAYQVMGDREAALSVYKKAVKEGIENPNSRPRAEDLSATCCSLALYAVEPDSELWSQIRQIRKGLGEPW